MYSLEQRQLNRANAPLQRNKICADHVYGQSMGITPAKFLKTPDDTPNSVLYHKRIELPRKANQCSSSAYTGIHSGRARVAVGPHPILNLRTVSPHFSVQLSNYSKGTIIMTLSESYANRLKKKKKKKTGPANNCHKNIHFWNNGIGMP